MNRKIYLLLLPALICTFSLSAQNITLEGGYFNPKRMGDETSKTYFDGIRIGATTEFGLKYNFGIRTGLLYNIGYSNKLQRFSMESDSVFFETWSHSLEIPLRIVYNQKLFWGISLFGFAGPNFQIGLIQNQKTTATLTAELAEMTGIQSGTKDLYKSDINRINIQLGAGGGLKWKRFILQGGYDWGVNNLDKTKNDYVTQSNWYVTFGYQIK